MPRKKIKIIEITPDVPACSCSGCSGENSPGVPAGNVTGEIVPDEPKKKKSRKGVPIKRPVREKITKVAFEALCKMQTPSREICDAFGVSYNTLVRWCFDNYGKNYEDSHREFSATGKSKIRAAQWKLLEKGSEKMAIWMGKQYLGQSDNPDEKAKQEASKSTIEALIGAIKNI